MTVSINDKLRKYKSLFSTTLSTGIGTGTGDTITPASVSGLPTDTPITLTFDRVDSGGVATPTKLERIRGIVSGGNFISYVRGKDGTTEQAHSAGAVIEMIWNADDLNDMVDWGVVEHNQDGTHKSALVTTLKATSAEVATGLEDAKIVTPKGLKDAGIVAHTKAAGSDITTGTDDAKYATSKALANADLNTRLKSKVITSTRDLTAATADISYTGVGFEPTSIIAICNIDGSTNSVSFGFADSGKSSSEIEKDSNTYWYKNDILLRASTSVGSSFQNATIKSYDSDGFTISWIKAGSPTGTANLIFLCFR